VYADHGLGRLEPLEADTNGSMERLDEKAVRR
jgi:hypothetical protein